MGQMRMKMIGILILKQISRNKMVICSRCGEVIESGWDYRWHFDKHMDEFDNAEDKQKYIEESTKEAYSKFLKQFK